MYRRSTHETRLTDLPAALAEALQAHASAQQLALTDVRVWSTESENPPASGWVGRLLGRRANPVDPDVRHVTVVVLHPTHLVVAMTGERRGTSVVSVPLVVASIARGSAVAARWAGVESSDGVSITGLPGDEGRPGTLFVGLGPGPDAQACVDALEAAIRRVKNPC